MSTIIEEIERMTVLDLVNLKKALEERWDITTLPTQVGQAGLHDDATGVVTPPEVDEQTEFSVVLQSWGENKIAVIKAVRKLTSLGLREAKELVESAPATIAVDLPRDDTEAIAARLREAGATTEIV